MRGNTNSYNVLGSETKVLNIVQEGTLVRDNLTISGFGNGYFSPAARVSGGVLSLDNSTSYSNIIDKMANADSWKINIKFETGDDVSNDQIIIGQLDGNYNTPQIALWDGGKLNICLSFNGNSWDYDEYYEILSVNTIYYLTLEFTGESYITTLYDSTKTLIATHTITDNTKIYNNGKFCFGADSGGIQSFRGKIYLEETNIEVDGQIGWNIVEIPGRITNIGDEIAVDLLLQQNKAKVELANNLQGLGVNANASTDSLETLAYKVSTVSADDDRQKPKGLAINTSTRNGDYGNINHYIVKNGWIFSRNGTSLKYKKLSALKTKVTTYDSDTPTNLSMSTKSPAVPSRGDIGDGYEQTIFFNADGSNMYVMNTESISKYTVQNYDTDALTFGTAVTLTPKIDNNYITIKWIDVNDAETKMLVCDTDGNLVLYDLTGDVTQNLTPIFSGESSAIWFFTNNSTDDLLRVYMPDGATYYISFWEFSNNTIGNQIGSTIEVIRSESYNWKQGILKHKDNNKYRIFLSSGGVNSYNIPSFIMIDCYTRTTTNIFCKLNNAETEVLGNLLTVTLTEVGTYKYVLSGMLLAVFDENWNLVGNFINRIKTDVGQNALQQTLLYDGDIFDFSDNNDNRVIYSAIKHKCWLDKLIAYERTATVTDQNDTEITRQLIYYPTLTADDLNAGFYDI